MLEQVRNEAKAAALEICQVAKLRKGQILVVGCSTSEVTGHKVGSYSSPELGQAIYDGIQEALQPQGIYLAAQCCEHLNRAIIMERQAAEAYGYEMVNVLPQPKAGGSFATTCWENFDEPVAVEHIRAHAGLDIGGTLIGMHLREVAVPVRIEQKTIGAANILSARTRLKFIGGVRAKYQQDKL